MSNDPYASQIQSRVESGHLIPLGESPCPTPGHEEEFCFTDTEAGKPAIWYEGQLYEKVSTGVAERISQAIHNLGG